MLLCEGGTSPSGPIGPIRKTFGGIRTRTAVSAVLCAVVALGALILPAGAASAAERPRFVSIQADAPGRDRRTNASLNAEYVVLKNLGTDRADLSGWTIRSGSKTFRFPDFSLAAGATVRVHSGSGRDDRNDLYWGRRAHAWANSGTYALGLWSDFPIAQKDTCSVSDFPSGSVNGRC